MNKINYVGSATALKPQEVLKLSSTEYLQRSKLHYVKNQFISHEISSLSTMGLSVDDLYALDRMHVLSKVLPYYQGNFKKPEFRTTINTNKPFTDSNTNLSIDTEVTQMVLDSSTVTKIDSHVGQNVCDDASKKTSFVSKKEFMLPNDPNNSQSNCHPSQGLSGRKSYQTNGFDKKVSNIKNIYQQNYDDKIEVNGRGDFSSTSIDTEKFNPKHSFRDNHREGGNQSSSHTREVHSKDHQENIPVGFRKVQNKTEIDLNSKTQRNTSLSNFIGSNGMSKPPQISQYAQKNTYDHKYSKKKDDIDNGASGCCESSSVKNKLKLENGYDQDIQGDANHHSKEPNKMNSLHSNNIKDHTPTLDNDTIISSTINPAIKVSSKQSVPAATESYEVVFGDKQQCNYFVLKQTDIAHIDAMEKELKKESLQIWSELSVDKKVVVAFDGRFYRGLINQNNTVTKLVDVGWFLPFDNQKAKYFVLPEKYKTKTLAFPINIGDTQHITRNTRCIIEEIGMFDEKVKSARIKQLSAVKTEIGTSDVSKQKNSVPKISQLVSHLSLNSPVIVTYISREENNLNHYVQDTKYASMYETWQQMANEQNDLKSIPNLGDFCLQMTEGEWVRTIVLALDPLTVYHIDYGSSEVVSKFEELKFTPEEMRTLAPLAYKIKFASNNEKNYTFGDQFKITPIQFQNDVYSVLKDDEKPPVVEDCLPKEALKEITTQVYETQYTEVTAKSFALNYQYKSAAINQSPVELNKEIEVFYVQDGENAKEVWVQIPEFAEQNISVWQQMCANSKAVFNIAQPGDFCIKLLDDLWSRAKILSTNPLTIFYIDFGDIEVVENISQIKPLPEELASYKPLGLKIKYDDDRPPLRCGDSISITPIQLEDGIYTILKDTSNIPTPPVKDHFEAVRYYFEDSAVSQSKVLELHKPVEVGFVQNDIHDPSLKWVQETKCFTFLDLWNKISIAQTFQFKAKPTKNEFCVISYEDIWCRARVVKVEPLTVFCIDYGNEVIIQNKSEIKPLPNELSTEKPFAHKIQFFNQTNADVTFNFADTFTMTPIEVKDNVLVVLKDKEEIPSVKKMMYESPTPSLKLNEITMAAWMQDDEFDPQYTWVQDLKNAELLNTFHSVLSESTSTLTQTPQLGDLCGKNFDGFWCRAKVVSLNPLTLFYIDYGNIEEVSINELKHLPPSCSKLPAFAYRIRFPLGDKPEVGDNPLFKFIPVALENNVYSATMHI